MTAALSDGKRLYAVRYATDDAAPSLYHRWSDTGRVGRGVRTAGGGEGGWEEVPPYSFCTFDGETAMVEDFLPCRLAAAAEGTKFLPARNLPNFP
jgi:predicted glutamine amidotransferase